MEAEMINEISGQQLAFHERVLQVPDSQRGAVETVLRQCGCKGNWSQAVTTVGTYNDFSGGGGVTEWSMSLPSKEDATRVQSALDVIE
jgi:hypothetical protein